MDGEEPAAGGIRFADADLEVQGTGAWQHQRRADDQFADRRAAFLGTVPRR
ncbi:hypothetical protein GCM10023086_47140 [Streptomyces venetus]|uniref:Uncharacterized protein n=1 Tax=Streptomyces venetus TaxID=1701086 RepID=A0ABP8GCZ6_9ACTN